VTVAQFDYDNIVSIRSLSHPDHAKNIVPTVKHIVWFLGKRCNYDCSYCGPHWHDAVSPFVNFDKCKIFIDQIDKQLVDQDNTIKWSFGGGEPTVDPSFLPMLEYLRKKQSTEHISFVTNGSAPLAYLKTVAKLVDVIIFSLHLERSDNEINRTINKILHIEKNYNLFISVNLMFLPGETEKVKQILKIFEDNNVKCVLRKIYPEKSSENYMPLNGKGKHAKLLDIEEQKLAKEQFKEFNDTMIATDRNSYYSVNELEFMEQLSTKKIWQNIGVWDQHLNYVEDNTDTLLTKNKNSFTDWICYAGVDNLSIAFDGSVYKADCYIDGAIGNINNQDVLFANKPTICNKTWCNCTADIAIRKCKSEKQHNLIGATDNE